MKIVNKIFNWYFGRNALPYWCIILFDLAACFFGGLFVMWLRHPASEMMAHWSTLLHTFLMFALFNLIGFRAFHTYSGILRYSQFIDLLKVMYAQTLSLVLALAFNFAVCYYALESTFYAITGRMTLVVYIGTLSLLCMSRILIKLLYESALVSKSAKSTLIYGTREGAIALTNNARNNKPVQFLIEGYISDDDKDMRTRLMGKRIYSAHNNLPAVIRNKQIKAVLISPLKHDDFVNNKQLQDLLINAGVKIYITQNAREWNKHKDSKGNVQVREVSIEDLLPRDEIQVDMESVGALLSGKKVLITGSIGMTAKREKEMGSLGMVIKGFKMGCNKAYWRIYGMNTAPRKGLFELGYNDKVLLHERQLEGWKKYLDDNPRRLMVKRMNPGLFTVMQNKEVVGRRCQMVGNCFLLDIPDKVAVVVHRRYTEVELRRLREEWLACGERGGVLVSAAISTKEKEVLREAMNRGYRIVLLRENGFPRLYKPCGESFYACSEGLLLQISPWNYHMEKKTITREQCLELNEMAERIAEWR